MIINANHDTEYASIILFETSDSYGIIGRNKTKQVRYTAITKKALKIIAGKLNTTQHDINWVVYG